MKYIVHFGQVHEIVSYERYPNGSWMTYTTPNEQRHGGDPDMAAETKNEAISKYRHYCNERVRDNAEAAKHSSDNALTWLRSATMEIAAE